MSRLELLSLVRFIREYFVSWGLLSFIYSLTLALLVQPMLERALGSEVPFKPLWAATCAILLIPGAIEAIRLPPLPLRRGLFGEALWRGLGGGALAPLYLRHELRRGTTWFALLVAVLAGSLLPPRKFALWVLVAQLPVQRALYSIHRWRGLALVFSPERGASSLIRSLWLSQTIQALVGWLALGASGAFATGDWLALGPATLGAVLSSSATCLEGDSGRPWLVNFFALAAGTLGGYLCLWSPWFLLLVAYICAQLDTMAAQRLKSVEHLDEDTLVP